LSPKNPIIISNLQKCTGFTVKPVHVREGNFLILFLEALKVLEYACSRTLNKKKGKIRLY